MHNVQACLRHRAIPCSSRPYISSIWDAITRWWLLRTAVSSSAAVRITPARSCPYDGMTPTCCLSAGVLVVVQDAGGRMPAPADVVAAGGVAKTVGSNTNYAFNASVPAHRQGFFSLLQQVRLLADITPVSSPCQHSAWAECLLCGSGPRKQSLLKGGPTCRIPWYGVAHTDVTGCAQHVVHHSGPRLTSE